MFKNVKLLSWISLLLLILALSLSSYAWYQAKVSSDTVIDITSETIDLKGSQSVDNLKPGRSTTLTFNLDVKLKEAQIFELSYSAYYFNFKDEKVIIDDLTTYFNITPPSNVINNLITLDNTTTKITLEFIIAYKDGVDIPLALLNTNQLVFNFKLEKQASKELV